MAKLDDYLLNKNADFLVEESLVSYLCACKEGVWDRTAQQAPLIIDLIIKKRIKEAIAPLEKRLAAAEAKNLELEFALKLQSLGQTLEVK
jgi:hypothetical protein